MQVLKLDKKKIAKMTTFRIRTGIKVEKEKDSCKVGTGIGNRKITRSKADMNSDQNEQKQYEMQVEKKQKANKRLRMKKIIK